MSAASQQLLSVVIPCLNEEGVLPTMLARLQASLEAVGMAWEVVFVDDGSSDRTFELLDQAHRADPRIRVVSLARNFGHQPAVMAGLEHSRGDVVAVMDADLQDPPELLAQCLERWRQGCEVIFAVRQSRQESTALRFLYATFYRVLQRLSDVVIPLDSGDFCVMDRRAVDVLRQMPERNMFVRGMRAWVGFRQEALPYDRPARAGGETKYSWRKLVRLALDGIFSFSTAPLRLATWIGLAIVLLSVAGVVFVVAWRFTGFAFMGHTADQIPGWAGAVALLLFFGAIQLLFLGLLGEYVGRIYEEVKQRPRWVVRRLVGGAGDRGADAGQG